ncbi:GDP-fucose synthetase [Wenyingzhuangia fucanilytica]|uniref:GDP-L-fucose synthase n=1 Tax=Wenyingzhuangia fucanilytica TaxID=1790137 RepID=A0A1B1Y7R5_9FLAO|nr:GDP-L-fucose synthase [Wenyingzhuangia fucanilytica]ANW96820.1 GDP-fucose synthetase [Wenyingzhuangia fucanilytica]
MKVLVTGGSGMVGKNLITSSKFSSFQILAPTSSELNLKELGLVDMYLKKHRPDVIVHAAGLVGGIQANMENPVGFLVDNLDMGKNIILSAKKHGVKNLINLASSCMYPRNAENPLKESLILQGELEPTNEGYALAKIICTRLCEYITNAKEGFTYKTIIPCNLYGKYDKFDPQKSHMIPAVIRKIVEAKQKGRSTVEIWGDGLAKREFMYVEDLVDFIHYALSKLTEMPQNINVGLGYDYSINEYYQAIANVIGYKGRFTHDLTKPVGMKQKVIDTKLLNEFGWKSKTSLEDGITKTLQYYKTLSND